MSASISVDLEKIAKTVNYLIPMSTILFGILGYYVSFYFHFLTVIFLFLSFINLVYLKFQKTHALLANFGIVAQMRYMIESVGPEFRQYLFMSDTEERPFDRTVRSAVYRKAKGVDSSSAFGSQLEFDRNEIKLRHSMFPLQKSMLQPYQLNFGEERKIKSIYQLQKPIIISAMSYGALGQNAVRALARGAKMAGIPMNTGEGGFPKYHLMENCDLIFQIGTAKFGVRNHDGTLNEERLSEIAALPQVKMIEIKMSQGAKPGKGGLLPAEKITEEIAHLRGVPMGKDVLSPPCHIECHDSSSTVSFIRRIQEVSALPVGIKLCLGREDQFVAMLEEMKKQQVFPDYITIDGSEGGTGAAPKGFMDDVGIPALDALQWVRLTLEQHGVKERMKLMCAGKMVVPGRQFMAYSMGAQALYTARGFMMALGCIQALQCNKNTCPVGITTHEAHLQRGLNVDDKARRVKNYVDSLMHEHEELLSSIGCKSVLELGPQHLYIPSHLK